ncbi:ubiquinone anaerobic biosynthesis accessory factor UbiT [Chromobacterium vaccinii]|uniref:ubiquinone anaerobic biosynthesis accessory factor UbiT n=1 Tax=Chromobacterium vaccinii TaxID=1108595 RepID=UPI003C771E63
MRVPDFALPAAAARLLSRLPAAPPSRLLAAALNRLIDSGALPADASLLAGKRFALELRDAGLTLRLAADERGFRAGSGQADLRLSASCADFARLLLREEDPDTLFFQRRLIVEGDTELGLLVKNLLDSIDWSQTPLARLLAA